MRALRERDGYYAERVMWLLSIDAKQALLDEHFREGNDGDAPGRLGWDLPDLSAFSSPTPLAERSRRRP